MRLTRREALARGGGLLAALGLGKFLPKPAAGVELEQVPSMPEDDLVRTEVIKPHSMGGSQRYTLQISHNEKDWIDAAQYLAPDGMTPFISREHVPPGYRYVRLNVETS